MDFIYIYIKVFIGDGAFLVNRIYEEFKYA